jgi:Na+/H+ antiporter NhaC
MTFKEFMAWYFFLGLTTMLIGVYRNLKNKQSSEPDELTVLTWFLLWWIWLPFLIFRVIYLKVKNKNV